MTELPKQAPADLRPLTELNQGQGVSFVLNADYTFFRGRQAVNIGLHEMRRVVTMLPLILAQREEGWQLLGITGPSGGRNVMVGPQGGWQGYYVPERLRMHPLALIKTAAGEFELGFSTAGARLFAGGQDLLLDAEGQQTERYRDLLQRLALHIRSRQLLQTAADRLLEHGLLNPLQQDDKLLAVDHGGYYRAGLAAITELPAAVLVELRDSGALNLAFALHFAAGNGTKFHLQNQRRQHMAVDQDVAAALNPEEEFSFNFDQ